jgi:hypothetical protein
MSAEMSGLRLLVTPADVPPHALGERRRGRPAELVARPGAGHDLRPEIPRTRRRVDDLGVADDLLDELGDLLDRDVLVADQVVDAVGGDLGQPERDAVGEVLDVDEPARLHAVSRQGERLALERLVDERRDDRCLPGAGAVRNPEAQDRVVDPVELLIALAVQLAGQLRAGVQVARRGQQRRLIDDV